LLAAAVLSTPPAAAADADPAADDFERAALGTDWTVWFGPANCGIVGSSDLGMSAFNAMCGASWTADAFAADSFSEGVTSPDKDPDMMGQVFVRRRSADNARYGLHYNNESTFAWEIKYDGVPSAQTRIVASSAGTAPLPGDVIRIEIVGQTIRGFHNGAEVVSGTDNAPDAITTAGPAGLVYRLKLGSSATYPTPMFESWRGGSLPVASETSLPALAAAGSLVLAAFIAFTAGGPARNAFHRPGSPGAGGESRWHSRAGVPVAGEPEQGRARGVRPRNPIT
jgi:hypothetical protein